MGVHRTDDTRQEKGCMSVETRMVSVLRRAARLLAAVTTVVAMLAASACGGNAAGSSDTDDEGGLKPVTFMLAWTYDTNHIGVFVADQKGYFKDAGLDVTIVPVSQSGAEHAVSLGVADFALSNLTNVANYDIKDAGLKQVLQVQQKPSAIWCALESNTAIQRPKDFDGKTFATFGTNESDAVVRQMIQYDGGKGEFNKVTVGTSTFQTLSSGQADFGGFYSTWEGVQAEMYGPKLRCFTEPDYGVPGNADTIGIITSDEMIEQDPETVKAFTQATQQGYEYAYEHPDEAAEILVDAASDAASDTDIDVDFVRRSMQVIIDGDYWGDPEAIASGDFVLGTNDFKGAQEYFDFLADSDAFTDENDEVIDTTPQAADLATDQFLKK